MHWWSTVEKVSYSTILIKSFVVEDAVSDEHFGAAGKRIDILRGASKPALRSSLRVQKALDTARELPIAFNCASSALKTKFILWKSGNDLLGARGSDMSFGS